MNKQCNSKPLKRLRRGMYVQLSDGSIELVTHTFRCPANTKFRKKGCMMFQSKNWVWHTVYSDDVQILGFLKSNQNGSIRSNKNHRISTNR